MYVRVFDGLSCFHPVIDSNVKSIRRITLHQQGAGFPDHQPECRVLFSRQFVDAPDMPTGRNALERYYQIRVLGLESPGSDSFSFWHSAPVTQCLCNPGSFSLLLQAASVPFDARGPAGPALGRQPMQGGS